MMIAMACQMYSNLWAARSLNGGYVPVRIGTKESADANPGRACHGVRFH